MAIATFNGKSFLEKQLGSIAGQTLPPDKVVICDDASTDETFALAKKFIDEKNLTSSWQLHQNSINLGYARNFYSAIDICDTDIIFLSDQDDIWHPEKIERMTAIMKDNPGINILSCSFGVIDEADVPITGIMVKKSTNTEKITPISTEAILRAYYWPGMTMVIRRKFYDGVKGLCQEKSMAHDFVLGLFAAETNSFYFYDFTGCYHRRHDANTAKEEHRIFKLLDFVKKKDDIQRYNNMLSDILKAHFPLKNLNSKVKQKYEEQIRRYDCLIHRRPVALIGLYFHNSQMMRLKSLLSDLWVICFGFSH
ncbi:MAG: glycosyltransferase [Verrucomicrobiota bacterium]